MPLQIVRNDITKMDCDAIVNAANEALRGGGGVDGAIHRAAGPGLHEECMTLGGCPTGQAKVTGGYALLAKYIIHTVGPRWRGGAHGERELLASCYRNSLRLAVECGCSSVAFPLISAGIYGYPKEQAMQVAVGEISSFLFEHELMVYLVVFDRDCFGISKKLISDIAEYIDERYVETHEDRSDRSREVFLSEDGELPENLPGWGGVAVAGAMPAEGPPRAAAPMAEVLQGDESPGWFGAVPAAETAMPVEKPPCMAASVPEVLQRNESPGRPGAVPAAAMPQMAPAAPAASAQSKPPRSPKPSKLPKSQKLPEPQREKRSLWRSAAQRLTKPAHADQPSKPEEAKLEDLVNQLDESFSQMLLRKIDEKNITDVECYKRANVDRKLFSKIRSDIYYKPGKTTVIAFAIALELSPDETRDMLMKAGYALSHSNRFDIIIEYFITRGIYDIFEINEALFAFDQCLLGSGARQAAG